MSRLGATQQWLTGRCALLREVRTGSTNVLCLVLPDIRRDVEAWETALHDGGPRRRSAPRASLRLGRRLLPPPVMEELTIRGGDPGRHPSAEASISRANDTFRFPRTPWEAPKATVGLA